MTPEIWTAADIAQWLKLSQRHVAERLVHEVNFPQPILGARRKQRWLRDEVVQWAQSKSAMSSARAL